MPKPVATKRGYLVMVRGLEDHFEWEAAFTGMITTKRAALREMARMRRESPHLQFAVTPVQVPKAIVP